MSTNYLIIFLFKRIGNVMYKNGNTLINCCCCHTNRGWSRLRETVIAPRTHDKRQTNPLTKWRRWHAISTLADWLDILATCEYNFSRADRQGLDKTCSYIKTPIRLILVESARGQFSKVVNNVRLNFVRTSSRKPRERPLQFKTQETKYKITKLQ